MRVCIVVLVAVTTSLVSSAPINLGGDEPSPQCDPGEENDCGKCYHVLVNELIINDRNNYNLQRAFFPPDTSDPVFVSVTYLFTRNLTGDGSTNYTATGKNETWFWTKSTTYLFQPIESVQFTSLLFADPSLREDNVTLYLQPGCIGNDSDHDTRLMLLTQRLKVYAMEQKAAARIDDDYSAKGQSLETLRRYHLGHATNRNGMHVTKYTLSLHIIFPIVTALFLFLLFYHLFDRYEISSIRNRLHNRDNDSQLEKDHHYVNAKPSTNNLWIITMALSSFTFVIYVIVLDCLAVSFWNVLVRKEIFYYPSTMAFIHEDVLQLFKMEYSIPILMLCYDIVVFLSLILFCVCIRIGRYAPKWYYILLGPLSCLSVHFYHIILGFIQTPQHAASIAIFYGVTIVVFILTLRIFYFYLYSCVYSCKCFKPERFHDESVEDESDKKNRNCCIFYVFEWGCCTRGRGTSALCQPYKWPHPLIVLILSLVSFLVAGFTVFVVVLFIINPINMAIEGAPDSLLSINQTVLLFFGAAVTYKIYKDEDSTLLALLVRAMNKATGRLNKQQNEQRAIATIQTTKTVQAVAKIRVQIAAQKLLKTATINLIHTMGFDIDDNRQADADRVIQLKVAVQGAADREEIVQGRAVPIPIQQVPPLTLEIQPVMKVEKTETLQRVANQPAVQHLVYQIIEQAVKQLTSQSQTGQQLANESVAKKKILKAIPPLVEALVQLFQAVQSQQLLAAFDGKVLIRTVATKLHQRDEESALNEYVRKAIQSVENCAHELVQSTLLQVSDKLVLAVNRVAGQSIYEVSANQSMILQNGAAHTMFTQALALVNDEHQELIATRFVSTIAHSLMACCNEFPTSYFEANYEALEAAAKSLITTKTLIDKLNFKDELKIAGAQLKPQNLEDNTQNIVNLLLQYVKQYLCELKVWQAVEDELTNVAKSDPLLSWEKKNGEEKKEAMSSYLLKLLKRFNA